jgi:MscS family membrane protein
VIVPNATLSNEPITNWSRMDTRKLALTFYLDIATKTKDMMAAMTDVEAMLAEDDRFETGSQKAYINQVTTRGLWQRPNLRWSMARIGLVRVLTLT